MIEAQTEHASVAAASSLGQAHASPLPQVVAAAGIWPAAAEGWRRARRIMVVEDDPLLQLDLVHLLEAGGHEVVARAGRGEVALSRFASAQAAGMVPDLVLMDIHLGRGMDGVAAAMAIRALDAGVAIAFRSAHVDEATRARASAVSPLAFLDKVVPIEAVLRLVMSAPARESDGRR